MNAYEINERIKNILPWWEYDNEQNNDTKNIAHIQILLDDGLEEIYTAMINDMGVMAEHGDDEDEILLELVTAEPEQFREYKEIFIEN